MKTSKRSRSLVTTTVTGALLVLTLGLAITIGSAQSGLPQPVNTEHTFAPDTIHRGEPALGLLVVHNQSAEPLSLDALDLELAQGLAYVGQAVDSDVTTSAEQDGATLRWTGPFDLAAGETLTVRYWLVAAGAAPGRHTSRASVSLDGKTLDAAAAPLSVLPAPAATTDQVAVPSSPAAPADITDVSVTKSAVPTSVRPGNPVIYTVEFSNAGASAETLDTIIDTLPPPFQFVGMAVGSDKGDRPDTQNYPFVVWTEGYQVPAGGTLTLRYWVWVPDETEPSFTPYVNEVTAASGGESIVPDQESVTVTGPKIEITKLVSPQEVMAGEYVTYTVTLENTGNDAGVVAPISDTLPAGFAFDEMLLDGTITATPTGVTGTIVWDGPFDMPIGAQETLVYRTEAGLAEPVADWVDNEVVALVNGELSAPGTVAVHVEPHRVYLPLVPKKWINPYFVVSKTASPTTVDENEEVVYTVLFTNPGSAPAELDDVFDDLPDSFTFVGVEDGTPPATVEQPGNILRLDGPFAPVGPGATLTLKYRVNVGTGPGSYDNKVTATTMPGTYPPKEPGIATVVVREPFLLWEDFESGTDGWEPFLNYWRLEPEQWYLKSNGGYDGSAGIRHTYWLGKDDPDRGAHDAIYMYLGEGSDDWTDYRVEAMIRTDARGVLGLWVRGKYIESKLSGHHIEGYYVTWQAGRDRGFDLFRLRTTGPTAYHFSDPLILASGGPEMALHKWYRVAVEVRGSNIRILVSEDMVNETLALEYDDSTFPTGTVGFVGYKMEDAGFDNVRVTPLD